MNEIQTTDTVRPVAKRSAFDLLAENCNIDRGNVLQLLKKTVCPAAAKDEEIAAFAMVAGKYKLDPFVKQIYAFPNKTGGITPIVGIDGWLAIINRQSNFDGMEVEMSEDGSSATCAIHLTNRSHPVRITEYMAECKRNTDPWKQFPLRMLRHKAIIQAARVAFNISGIYDEDEGRDVAEGHTMREAKSRTLDENPFVARNTPAAIEAPQEPQKEPIDWQGDTLPGLEPEPANTGAQEAYRD